MSDDPIDVIRRVLERALDLMLDLHHRVKAIEERLRADDEYRAEQNERSE